MANCSRKRTLDLSTRSSKNVRPSKRLQSLFESNGAQELSRTKKPEANEKKAHTENTCTKPKDPPSVFFIIFLILASYGFRKAHHILKTLLNFEAEKEMFTRIDDILGHRLSRAITYLIKAFKAEVRIRLKKLKMLTDLVSIISTDTLALVSDEFRERRKAEASEREELQWMVRLQKLEVDRLRKENESLKSELVEYEWAVTEVLNQISRYPDLEDELREVLPEEVSKMGGDFKGVGRGISTFGLC